MSRRHVVDKPGDNRGGAERDRDRLLYSDAFRRLGGITQVVGAHEGQTFHNRLSHTIKVAQVGRRIAERLIREQEDAGLPLDPDVVEAAALAHDLGHPPFGHVAELELRRQVAQHDLQNSFEGNAQSFRIVTKTAVQGGKFSGLNLTRATLRGILKYPWTHDPGNEDSKAHRKWGAYSEDAPDFRFALGLPERQPLASPATPNVPPYVQSLEAQVMDWADDITYAVHDVEDFYRAGIVPMDRLASSDDSERRRFAAWVETRWSETSAARSLSAIEGKLETLAQFIPVTQPYDGARAQRLGLRNMTSLFIRQYVLEATALSGEGKDAQLAVDEEIRFEVDILKELTWFYAIEQPALGAQQYGQISVIKSLFEIMFEACQADPENRGPRILPHRCHERLILLRDAGMHTERTCARIVADAICEFTEDEALRLYRRLAGVEPGSVLDAIVR